MCDIAAAMSSTQPATIFNKKKKLHTYIITLITILLLRVHTEKTCRRRFVSYIMLSVNKVQLQCKYFYRNNVQQVSHKFRFYLNTKHIRCDGTTRQFEYDEKENDSILKQPMERKVPISRICYPEKHFLPNKSRPIEFMISNYPMWKIR